MGARESASCLEARAHLLRHGRQIAVGDRDQLLRACGAGRTQQQRDIQRHQRPKRGRCAGWGREQFQAERSVRRPNGFEGRDRLLENRVTRRSSIQPGMGGVSAPQRKTFQIDGTFDGKCLLPLNGLNL
jgi:hypothetical protein